MSLRSHNSDGTAISKGKAGGKAAVAKSTRSRLSTRRRILAPRREDDDNDDDEDFILSDRD